MSKCIITIEDNVASIKCKYDADFVETLKDTIPHKYRKWDGDKKIWRIEKTYIDDLINIANEYFSEVIVDEWIEGKSKTKTKTKETDGTDWKKLALSLQSDVERLKDLLFKQNNSGSSSSEWDRIKQFMTKSAYKDLYRVLAKQHHPDVTKDNGERMKQINAIFEKYK